MACSWANSYRIKSQISRSITITVRSQDTPLIVNLLLNSVNRKEWAYGVCPDRGRLKRLDNAPSIGRSVIQVADQALLTSFGVLIAAARSSASAKSAGTDDVGK